MARARIVIVGAGPAGVRAAERLVASGFRPIVIDEASCCGGQVYRRPPGNFTRSYTEIYGSDAGRARSIHESFDRILPSIDYRQDTTVWNISGNELYTVAGRAGGVVEFDAVIFATGATDRLAPVRGWTLPGCYSLGGAQIALKAQGCAIGKKVVLLGTGPLLYLVAYQYSKAGIEVRAVLDTAPFSAQLFAIYDLLARPELLVRGAYLRTWLAAKGIPVHNGITCAEIVGSERVTGVRWRFANHAERVVEADAVGLGFHLRSESQLADLGGIPITFDAQMGQWQPECDEAGRTQRQGIYLAGDCARILGAHAAEVTGRLAALSVMADQGLAIARSEVVALRSRMRSYERFSRGVRRAFPWPSAVIRKVPDDVLICRCESITAGELRKAGVEMGAPELNRAKAFSRVGMGRCQGRYCGPAASEVLAGSRSVGIDLVGRFRAQAPVKPLTAAIGAPGAS